MDTMPQASRGPEMRELRLVPLSSACGVLALVFFGAARVLGLGGASGGEAREEKAPAAADARPASGSSRPSKDRVVDPRLVWTPPVGRPYRVSSEDEPRPSTAHEVARETTPLSELELAEALIEGHRAVFGEPPTWMRLAVAWAHVALENGRGREIECNNFGNVIATDSWPGAYYVRDLHERTRKNRLAALGDDWKPVPMKFRAYATPAEGARAYWKVLDEHYASALGLFGAGAPYLAARRLAELGYATAYAEPYAHAMVDLHGEFVARILPQIEGGGSG